MNDKETAAHIRRWVRTKHGVFAWPTDACGYDQHVRFVRYRNEHWTLDYSGTFEEFLLKYADKLESGQIPKFESTQNATGRL